MNSNLKWKALFIIGVILICIIGLVGRPDFPPKSWAGIKSNFADSIKLGLDLQGGTHLILQVQGARRKSRQPPRKQDQTLDHLTSQLREQEYPHTKKFASSTDTQILIHNIAPEQAGSARNLISDPVSGLGYFR